MISRCFTIVAGIVPFEMHTLSAPAAARSPTPQSGFEFQVWGEAKMPK